MRWSLTSAFFIIAVFITGEVVVSAPINVDSNILLEARSRSAAPAKVKEALKRPRRIIPATSSHGRSGSPLRAGHFKKSSKTYRNAALKAPTFHPTGTTSSSGSSTTPIVSGNL